MLLLVGRSPSVADDGEEKDDDGDGNYFCSRARPLRMYKELKFNLFVFFFLGYALQSGEGVVSDNCWTKLWENGSLQGALLLLS